MCTLMTPSTLIFYIIEFSIARKGFKQGDLICSTLKIFFIFLFYVCFFGGVYVEGSNLAVLLGVR